MKIPALTAAQMAEIDKLAPENGLEIIQMMEHAGLQIARFSEKFIFQSHAKKRPQKSPYPKILILAGKGHNGGDGIAAARFLKNWGFNSTIILSLPESELKKACRHHLKLIKKMSIPVSIWKNHPSQKKLFSQADLILDGLLGYPSKSNPHGAVKELIILANKSHKKIIAIDLSSGLDATNGKPYTPCIRAAGTITLALPKTGLLKKTARPFVGALALADLGIPAFIYEKIGIYPSPKIFQKNSIIKI